MPLGWVGGGGLRYARVVFLRSKGSASATSADFVVSYSTTTGAQGEAGKCASKTISLAKDAVEHWVEVQFPIGLNGGRFGGGGCGGGVDVVVAQPGAEAERIVFNLIEISKNDFAFRLSPWLVRLPGV